MGTQGVVSVVKNGETKVKVVVGCEGYNADGLAERIKAEGLQSIHEIYEAARVQPFGCIDCLVVMDKETALPDEEDLFGLYRDKFGDPEFNPRWRHGTAAHVVVIQGD